MTRSIAVAAGLLTLFALIGVGLVAATNLGTAEQIIANQEELLLRSVTELVPPERCDNDVFQDTLSFVSPELLGSADPVVFYRAYDNGEPVAVVFAVVAPDGYSGRIRIMVGINHDGSLAGARVLEHKETPGLGNRIELSHSDWILGFEGLSLNNPEQSGWRVKKDGGEFDQFTGATITPRAVVKAIHNALLFYDQNRDAIFPEDTSPVARIAPERS